MCLYICMSIWAYLCVGMCVCVCVCMCVWCKYLLIHIQKTTNFPSFLLFKYPFQSEKKMKRKKLQKRWCECAYYLQLYIILSPDKHSKPSSGKKKKRRRRKRRRNKALIHGSFPHQTPQCMAAGTENQTQ